MAAPALDPVTGTGPTHDLAEVTSRTVRRLQQEHRDVEGTLQAITATAIEVVPHAEECGISYVIGRSEVEARASTSDLPREVDALQERIGQGPCTDAVGESEVVRVDDVGADTRWPDFSRQAPALGVGSMLCCQLFVDGDQLGALDLYAGRPGAFDDESQDIVQLFAAHAAVAIAGAEHEENLRTAVGSRDLVGQAEGILVERHEITADQAFGVLVQVSQEVDRKLSDVAGELTDTGAVPSGNRRRA